MFEKTSTVPAFPMRAAVIAGSHRRDSQSGRVARYIAARCELIGGQAPYLLDLGESPLPLWNEPPLFNDELWDEVGAQLHACDAVVVVTPEWGGMAPGALKNFFLLCEQGELAHKPGCLVGVSASNGGSYPLAELRMSSYKNTHLCYIPEQIIIRQVELRLHPHADGEAEGHLRARLDYVLGMLAAYAGALAQVRASGRVDLVRYPFGM